MPSARYLANEGSGHNMTEPLAKSYIIAYLLDFLVLFDMEYRGNETYIFSISNMYTVSATHFIALKNPNLLLQGNMSLFHFIL